MNTDELQDLVDEMAAIIPRYKCAFRYAKLQLDGEPALGEADVEFVWGPARITCSRYDDGSVDWYYTLRRGAAVKTGDEDTFDELLAAIISADIELFIKEELSRVKAQTDTSAGGVR